MDSSNREPCEIESRIIERIRSSRQYLDGSYPYFVWPYKGIQPILPDELSWLVDNLAAIVPSETNTLLSFMTDGDLLTMPLSLSLRLPVLIGRDKPYNMSQAVKFVQKTGYFTRDLYIDTPPVGCKICIVEAIISTGGTVCAAGAAMLSCGCELTGVITAITKLQFGGTQSIRTQLNIHPRTLFTISSDISTGQLNVERSKSE
jgi:adenine phosphoribosyltransferase